MQKHVYRISFLNGSKIYEIFAKEVSQSSMFGFIEVGDFIFDAKSQVVVDPSEERLKAEFADVKRTYIPMNSILRIDEVKKSGTPKIVEATSEKGKVSPFPASQYIPTGGPFAPKE